MNVFITGATSGIGLELGKLYLKDGFNVGVCSIESPDDVSNILPGEFNYYQANVVKKEEVANAIIQFKKDFGDIHIVIANAGINHPKGKIPDFEICRKVIDVNIHGVINTFDPAIKIMCEQRFGQLVSMSSVSGITGMPGMSVYGATKSFIRSLLETFAIDLTEFGIHTTCIAPSFIATHLTKDNQHKMPFLLNQAKAAKNIHKAIKNKKTFYVMPFPMNVISKILYWLPRTWYIKLMRLDFLGLSKDH